MEKSESTNMLPAANDEKIMKDVTDVIGQYGPWQKCIFLLICLRGIPTAFFNMTTPFFAPTMDFWCARPNGMFTNLTVDEWLNQGIPLEEKENKEVFHSQCKMYKIYIIEGNPVIDRNKTIYCDAWEFNNSFYTATIRQEYELVCSSEWLISCTQSIYMAGMMVGVFVFGHLADRFGRYIIINLSVTLMVVAGIATAFSPNFTIFNIMRFALALGVAGTQATTFSLLLEILGPQYRTRVTFAFSFGWAFGLLMLSGMAYLIRDWHNLQLFSTTLTSILLCYWWTMPESPRWLITRGRYKEAEVVMLKAVHKNKIQVHDIPAAVSQIKEVIELEERMKNPNVIDLFRTSNLRKNTICVYIIYFSCGFVFYGFLLNQTAFDGNPFLNFFIGSAVEIPAYILCVLFVKYLKRKTSLFLFCFSSSIACFFLIPLGKEYLWLRVVAGLIGKLCISGAFVIINIFSAEIFPTVVRTVGSGTSLMMGRVGAMFSPFIKEIGQIHVLILPITFGVLSLIAALLLLPLPETYELNLPDTIKEAEKIGKFTNGTVKFNKPSVVVNGEEASIPLNSTDKV